MADRHDDHDLGLIVAFADDELQGEERATAEDLIASCPPCAALVVDLRLLSAADRSMATPARPRDFRLTAADAARLTASPEPVASGTRLDGVKTLPVDHPTHDPLLIAAATDGTLDAADQRRADAWLEGCSACAELHDDLVAIAAANRAMPTPPRPRDYRLSPDDADRALGRGWRGFLARIGSSRDALSRPLAVGLTTLGLAGLLLSGGTSLLPTSSSSSGAFVQTVGAPVTDGNAKGPERISAPVPTDGPGVFAGSGESAASAAPSAAAAAAPEAGGPIDMTGDSGMADGLVPIPTDAARASGAAAASGAADAAGAVGAAGAAGTAESVARDVGTPSGPPAPVVISALLLVLGVGLFAVRWIARRRAA